MDAGQPDSKRPRLMSWSSGASQPPPLLHAHSKQLPPPQPHQPGPHGHPSPYPPSFAPRPSDHPSAPPPAASPHGHPMQHPDADRRRQDQEPFAPMHDHYRQQPAQQQPPSQSPVHPSFAGYSSRDVSIKRESLEDPRRSNSIGGHGPDHQSHHPLAPSHSHQPSHGHHQGPPPPHIAPSYGDNQRHMQYDNSPTVPATPGSYRHYPPPPSPMGHSTYESQPTYQPAAPAPAAPPEPIYSVYPSAANPKKKNTRASQACDQCRQLKAKCDETKPCKTCRDKGTECRYRDPVPKPTDKAHTDIIDGLAMMQNSMSTLSEHFNRLEDRLINVETLVTGQPAEPKKMSLVKPVLPRTNPEDTRLRLDESARIPENSIPRPSQFAAVNPADMNGGTGDTHQLRMADEDEMETEPGPPVLPGEPAIPINHTTLAGLLLEWSSIRELTKHHLDRNGVRFISEYPISQEQRRGLLIPYGRGEDVHPSRPPRESYDASNPESSEEGSDAASPSPSPAADWGHLGGMSPSEQVEYHGGALTSEGNPDFSEDKVWAYVDSFKANILNMHPILQPPILDDWIRHFLDSIPSSSSRQTPKPQTVKSAFAVGGSTPPIPDTTGNKRKRSPATEDADAAAASSSNSFRPSRTIHNALILTILALGKICIHRERVPDALQPTESQHQGSPSMRNGVPGSPNNAASPPNFLSRSQSSGLPSPRDVDGNMGNRRSSFRGTGSVRSGYGMKKNFDVIPGLEYFAMATDIMGNHLGSYNNMKNVYTNIFAGLYQGQLGRPLESFAFIHQASHKLQVIMRPSLSKLRVMRNNTQFLIQEQKYNQLTLAFWTCLQLESDLIAELPLPPSGLLSYENEMPHPNMSLLRGFPQNVLDSYPGQLYLRTHLNSIHRMFYSPEDPTRRNSADEAKFKNVELVLEAVSSMKWIAPNFAFKESDPPATDILSARLRAKYWGAQVITHRPFIRQLLQFSHNNKHPSSPNPPATSEFRAEIDVPRIAPQAKSSSEIDPELVRLAEKGIKALIESTRAFHGLGDERPIITNVFGTAHAQWGNLLVLSAASRDPILNRFVDMSLLQHLFEKTIAFLRQSATATSCLKIDMHILEGIYQDFFFSPEQTGNGHLQTPQLPMAAPPMVSQSSVNGNAPNGNGSEEGAVPI